VDFGGDNTGCGDVDKGSPSFRNPLGLFVEQTIANYISDIRK
jgi:hypothetical protein